MQTILSVFVFISFVDASDDGPSQKEISHVLVRLLLQGTLKQFNAIILTHAKKIINSLTQSQPQIPSKEAQASICPSKTFHATKRHNKMWESPRPNASMFKLSQKIRTRRANSTQKGSSLTFLLLLTRTLAVLPQHVHGGRKAFLAVTAHLAADPLPRPIQFLVQGHVTIQCHLCQLTQGKERFCEPKDVQRVVALPSREPLGGRIFVFRPSFAFTLPHWTLWTANFPFVPQTRDVTSITASSFFRNCVQGEQRTLLEDISREEGYGCQH